MRGPALLASSLALATLLSALSYSADAAVSNATANAFELGGANGGTCIESQKVQTSFIDKDGTTKRLEDAEGFPVYVFYGGTCSVTNEMKPSVMRPIDVALVSASDELNRTAAVTGNSPYAPICETKMLKGNMTKVCGKVMVNENAGGTTIMRYKPGYDKSECGDGLFLPFFPNELMWNNGTRVVLYLIAMIYCFLGVSIIADKFMVAIEVITAKEVKKKVKRQDGKVTEETTLVWNETIANLSLMALGSSAPEILLAVLEAIGQLNTIKR
jgi:hypothetical protein